MQNKNQICAPGSGVLTGISNINVGAISGSMSNIFWSGIVQRYRERYIVTKYDHKKMEGFFENIDKQNLPMKLSRDALENVHPIKDCYSCKYGLRAVLGKCDLKNKYEKINDSNGHSSKVFIDSCKKTKSWYENEI